MGLGINNSGVPYTNATGNVDLGTNSITAYNFISISTGASEFLEGITADSYSSVITAGIVFACVSTSLNTNLNADLLDGLHANQIGGASGTTDHSALTNLTYATAGHTGFEPAFASGTTAQFLRGDKTFATPPGGASSTTDHAGLVNLAYASAGHIGFQATLTSQNAVGTADQVLISGGTGALLASTSFSLPQSIGTASSVQFASFLATNTAVIGVGTILTNSTLSVFSNINNYSQINHQNLSSGNSASTDFIATADNGNDSTYYVDLGINGSGYNNPAYSIGGANTSYLYASNKSLAIGIAENNSANAIIFHTLGTQDVNEKMRIANSGNLLVGTGTDDTVNKVQIVGNIRATNGTGTFATLVAGSSIVSSVTATSTTSIFNAITADASIFTSIQAEVGTSHFQVILAGASIFTSITASGTTSVFNAVTAGAINAGASVLTSITATGGTSSFQAVNAGSFRGGATILTSLSMATSTVIASTAFIGGSLRVSGTYIGVSSNNIASTGTGTILAATSVAARSSGYLKFVFTSGTSAFVPFFLSATS